MVITKLEGIINPLPSTRKGGITDIASFVNVIDYVTSAEIQGHKIAGQWLFGATGEYNKLSDAERIAYHHAATAKLNGNSLLFVNITGRTVDDTLRYREQAESFGADALVIMPDCVMGADYVRCVEEIVKRTNLPIALYVNTSIGDEQGPDYNAVKDLSQNPRVIGMKVSGQQMDTFLKYANLSSDTFGVLQGMSSQLRNTMEYLAEHGRKLDGVVLGPVNFNPNLVIRAFYGIAPKGGNLEDNWRAMDEIIEGYSRGENNIAYLKEQLLAARIIKSAELLGEPAQGQIILIPTPEDTLRILRASR